MDNLLLRLTLGTHAQRGLQFACLLVFMSVCVDAYSGTTDYEATYVCVIPMASELRLPVK